MIDLPGRDDEFVRCDPLPQFQIRLPKQAHDLFRTVSLLHEKSILPSARF